MGRRFGIRAARPCATALDLGEQLLVALPQTVDVALLPVELLGEFLHGPLQMRDAHLEGFQAGGVGHGPARLIHSPVRGHPWVFGGRCRPGRCGGMPPPGALGHTEPMTGNLGDGRIVVGTARTERADAIDLARNWLDAVWRRDLAAAAAMMTPGARVTISGGHQFAALEAFAAFAAERYAEFRKQADAFEACEAAGGLAVYVRGTLSGTFKDGVPFSAVRWCDRFLVAQGRIIDIETWSDIAETRAGAAAT